MRWQLRIGSSFPFRQRYLPAKGAGTAALHGKQGKEANQPKLQIDGILLTMVDSRTNFAKEISALLREPMAARSKYSAQRSPILSVQRKSAQREKVFSPMTLVARWQRVSKSDEGGVET